jgi:hypothetical protein
MRSRKPITDAELEKLQRESFSCLLLETNPGNGLVIDKTAADWAASITATGLALGQRGELDQIGSGRPEPNVASPGCKR